MKAKVVSLAPVGVVNSHPELKTEEVKVALRDYFQQRTQ